MFQLYDKVRVMNTSKRQLIKEGIVVGLTSSGAHVYQPNCDPPYSDSMTFAEWFPFNSRETKILSSAMKRRK